MKDTLLLGDVEMERAVLGPADSNLRALREAIGVAASVRDGRLSVEGEEPAVRRALEVCRELVRMVEGGLEPGVTEVERLVHSARGSSGPGGGPAGSGVRVFGSNRYVRPRSPGQARYLSALENSEIVFATGPAGTGKTYLAVARACAELASGRAGRIVLARPAVEAGEKLGFLPGDFREKVNPYLRPLHDALAEMIPERDLLRYSEAGTIEVVPLAYMRGRTLNGAYVILDEAQNTTVSQMKMFLTRLGANSRAAVVGDVTQTDLPSGEVSGMRHAMGLLSGIEGLAFVELSADDVVRHRLVKEIVLAYEQGRAEAPGESAGGKA
ncbi:MAG TPA: PhoH family protein [Planctomycetota bacterium]|nr:PhoH family protein [Planctomycetota bacterium]